jgi:hypothetical protein
MPLNVALEHPLWQDKAGQKSLRIRLANRHSRGIIRLHNPCDNLLAATGDS